MLVFIVILIFRIKLVIFGNVKVIFKMEKLVMVNRV